MSPHRDPVLVAIADRLRAAHWQGQIDPIAACLPRADAATAYAVQAIVVADWTAQGRNVIGRKIGLTSPAVQRQLGVDQPDYGTLFDDMAIPDGGTVAVDRLLQPRIEAEIAFTVGRTVNIVPSTIAEMAGYLDGAMPAFEIVDSRIRDWRITLADTIADNGSSARFVVGGPRRPLDAVDFVGCTMTMSEDDVEVSSGNGAACLGNPLAAALWLARTMIEMGTPLRAGDLLLSGALGPMVPFRAGCRYAATISGVGSVSVSAV